jgi:predicted RNA-binding Zn-ribbon protein involved in translation (DUF1610 family)
MPTEPPDFDCCNAGQVLRLRFRDWMWPLAILMNVGILVLVRAVATSGPYRIGSLTFFVNIYGPPLMLVLFPLAGARWCWLGRVRRMPAGRCAACGYHLTGLTGAEVRCPECGLADVAAGATASKRPRRRVPLSRWLIDLPGLFLIVATAIIFVGAVLMMMGVIDEH